MQNFLYHCGNSQYEAWIVDPQTANVQAIRAYEKAGFKKIRTVHDGKTTLMIRNMAIKSDPFSFIEILELPPIQCKTEYLDASDWCKLAYVLHASVDPQAVCILYHGGGIYGTTVYHHIGQNLANDHKIVTYVMDIRGHGNSGGPRGDAPSVDAVWEDITVVINQAKVRFPHTPIYLAGHSSGAGLILNYAVWPTRTTFDGMILLAPYLGPKSGALEEYVDPEYQFIKKASGWILAIAGMSNGYFCSHVPAIYFNYPYEFLNDDKILSYYTATMAIATTPYNIHKIFPAIEVPTAMFIASHDEQFRSEVLASWAKTLPKNINSYSEVVPAKHLSILVDGAELIAKAINRLDPNVGER